MTTVGQLKNALIEPSVMVGLVSYYPLDDLTRRNSGKRIAHPVFSYIDDTLEPQDNPISITSREFVKREDFSFENEIRFILFSTDINDKCKWIKFIDKPFQIVYCNCPDISKEMKENLKKIFECAVQELTISN